MHTCDCVKQVFASISREGLKLIQNVKRANNLFVPVASSASVLPAYTKYAKLSQRVQEAAVDQVEISHHGVLSAKLAEQCKECVKSFQASVSPTRMAQLKKEYAGQNCPVSAHEIAQAMYQKAESMVWA